MKNNLNTKLLILGLVLMIINTMIHFTSQEVKKNEIPTAHAELPKEDTNKVTEPDSSKTDKEEKNYYSTDEYILAKLMIAEAENQSEEGKRLVVACVLNRLDENVYGETIEEVIYQKNAFSCIENGRFDNVTIYKEDLELVRLEMENRSNTAVKHFRTDKFHDFGDPAFKVEDHYFSY